MSRIIFPLLHNDLRHNFVLSIHQPNTKMPLTISELPTNLTSRGERIKWARDRLGLTQDALGKRMGKDQTTVGKWERNEAVPRDIEKLAEELQIPSPAWLAFGVASIDQLDGEAIEHAHQFQQLDHEQRALARALFSQLLSK